MPIQPLVPLPPSYDGQLAYKPPGSSIWLPITEDAYKVVFNKEQVESDEQDQIQNNRAVLTDLFSKALQFPNLGFFAGSGTSLGAVKGPSMWQLWQSCMCQGEGNELTEAAAAVCDKVRYAERESPNIEHFLSQCDAYLSFNEDDVVVQYLLEVKEKILVQCTNFLADPASDIACYRHLLQKLARRRVRDPRLKVFTTNYDMCFETAASDLGMMVVDGFSYTRKRRFDGRHFNYDVVRREMDNHEFVEGIFQLHKLHGSVSWEREGNEIFESSQPSPDKACLIYPAKGKYQQAFIQPHLELLSRFLDFLRQSNSCLLVAGFGFNDDHLSEPILSAIQSNPSLKLILTDHRCIHHLHNRGNNGSSPYWAKFEELALKGFDIHFISGSFSDVVDQIPSLRAMSPAEQLANAVRRVGWEQ
ncbi:SIR2 family protein [Marinobacterium marinum]|uniref:SIR2 family protein n=1 Tax=Marinobacterium marinum TaxID=2756129 RepID=A0A7W1WZT4_9GAMM|nr:SIR2 family protein [Marinobacterium marinum]MBA4503221.1 SIR2 family protein [Marinobacterium marinum]